jgi:hypothetical protein
MDKAVEVGAITPALLLPTLRTNALDGAKAPANEAEATTKADTATDENFMVNKE